ncbi:MAG: alkyl/aryl-sulfatase [Pseudomonadota bacterium]
MKLTKNTGETRWRSRRQLEEHSTEFRRELIRVTEGVYVAVGFDESNASMIEGDDGMIVIDTLLATEAAKIVLREFRRVTTKPVRGIIYTHSHMDHISGATVFAGEGNPDIFSRAPFSPEKISPLQPILMRREARQFGRHLPSKDIINRGLAPGKAPTGGFGKGYIPPNRTFKSKRLKTNMAGVKIILVAAPGETDDQLYAWLPEKKVLFCGDNYYKVFPNLYAIRGTTYRDVRQWADSLDEMSRLGADFLVPGHTRPVSGRGRIKENLENYRDAILAVYHQTIEEMNRGLTPDELVEVVKLPSHLADKPYLQEFYGAVPWAVRSIYNGHLGWFDGNPTNLFPLSPREESRRLAIIAGGEIKLMNHLKKSIQQKDWQWACRLADHIMALNDKQSGEARKLKIKVLRALSEIQINAPARNYYLSCARELALR